MKQIVSCAIALGLMGSVSACGLTGELKRPGPLIGNPGAEVNPATLPDGDTKNLPRLPDRPQDATAEEQGQDDELLGGPGS